MRVSVFGMGYVGVATAACLAKDGHRVIGVDVLSEKITLLHEGKSPVVEDGLSELVHEMVSSGRLRATENHELAIRETEVSLVSVGTPSLDNGSLDLRAVKNVARKIGSCLEKKSTPHTIIIRSTLLPGSTAREVIPEIETASGKTCGTDFHVGYNPEFLREGSSIADFYDPPYTVIGADSPKPAADCEKLYRGVAAPIRKCSVATAEALKYVSNSYHALKVAFANEVGVIMRSLNVDSLDLMKLFAEDKKLNISKAYLTPGFAFGGSCLPKDLRALVHVGKRNDLDLPLLGNVMRSNEAHINRAENMVLKTGERDVALLGLSFKQGTDDLRESPLVILAERLIGKGVRLRIFDREVALGKLVGTNKRYIEAELPHIGELLTGDLDKALETAKVAIVGNAKGCDPKKLAEWASSKTVIDLARVPVEVARAAQVYHGIAWDDGPSRMSPLCST